MRIKQWMNMKTIDFEDPKEQRLLKKYDKFLTGKNMISQKEHKKKGEEISYFEVIKVEGNNIEYVLKYEILEDE